MLRVGRGVDVAFCCNVLLGVLQHVPVAFCYCLLLLGIAMSSFFAQLLMTRSFQIMPAVRAAAVSFTGEVLGGWRAGGWCVSLRELL